jgi:hypothetical protein
MNLRLFGHGPLQRQVMHHRGHSVIRKPTADTARGAAQRVCGDATRIGMVQYLLSAAPTRSLLHMTLHCDFHRSSIFDLIVTRISHMNAFPLTMFSIFK